MRVVCLCVCCWKKGLRGHKRVGGRFHSRRNDIKNMKRTWIPIVPLQDYFWPETFSMSTRGTPTSWLQSLKVWKFQHQRILYIFPPSSCCHLPHVHVFCEKSSQPSGYFSRRTRAFTNEQTGRPSHEHQRQLQQDEPGEFSCFITFLLLLLLTFR